MELRDVGLNLFVVSGMNVVQLVKVWSWCAFYELQSVRFRFYDVRNWMQLKFP